MMKTKKVIIESIMPYRTETDHLDPMHEVEYYYIHVRWHYGESGISGITKIDNIDLGINEIREEIIKEVISILL